MLTFQAKIYSLAASLMRAIAKGESHLNPRRSNWGGDY